MPQAPKATPVPKPPAQKPAPKKAPAPQAKAQQAVPKTPATKTLPAPQSAPTNTTGNKPSVPVTKSPAPKQSEQSGTAGTVGSTQTRQTPANGQVPANEANTSQPAARSTPTGNAGTAPQDQPPAGPSSSQPTTPLGNLWNQLGLGGTTASDKPTPATSNPTTANGTAEAPNLLDTVSGLLGGSNPPKLTPEQQQSLEFARSMMAKEKLGGIDGRFNQGDVDAIAQAVARDRGGIRNLVLAQTKTALEYNIANEVLTNGVNGVGAKRDVLALADQRITNQVTGTLRNQMSASLTQQGIKGPADGKADLTSRSVTVEEMARFEDSMRVIEAMTRGKGLPGMTITLPQGPSAQTFADITAGKLKPEGVEVAFGDGLQRGGSTATTTPGGVSQTSSSTAATAKTPEPISLREQLRQAEIAARQPKPSALPPDVRQAAEYVQYMLNSNKLGGSDLTLNHGDIPAVAGALRGDVNGIAPQVLAQAGGGLRGFAARRALNGHNGPFARRANAEISNGLYSQVQGQLGGSLSQSGITGNTRDNTGRNLTVAELQGFERSMAVVQRFGEQQAAANGFRINPPSSGIPQQMMSDLLNERVPQFGSVQVTNPALASGAGANIPSRSFTSTQNPPVSTGQPAPPNSGFAPVSNPEMRPAAMGPSTPLGQSPSNSYVQTARGLVPMENYSPEMRQQFGMRSNAPYIPSNSSTAGRPAPSQPAQPSQPTQPSQPASVSNSSPVFLGNSPSNRYVETPQGLLPYETYLRNNRR